MGIKTVSYAVVNFLILSYKWFELKCLQLFRSYLERKILGIYAPLGIVFDFVSSKDEEENGSFSNHPIYNEEYVRKVNEFGSIVRVKIFDKGVFPRIANVGSLAMGESYMDGSWTCSELTELTRRVMRKKLMEEYLNPWNRFLNYLQLSFFNLQTERKAWEVGRKHYDLGNDLFQSFLDPFMNYSCGYWAKASNLEEAQINKMDLIAKKLNLQPGMRVLDIGCGWGGLCKFLAKNYGVECVGVTISEEGVKYGREVCQGLPVDIRLMDYRKLNEQFDRIVSVGMFEHVGLHNYREYFKVAHRCLKDDGIFLLHTIGFNHKEMVRIEPWFHSYIFPNGCLPYHRDITRETEGLFIIEDWHNFGPDYAKTLHAWLDNFKRNWPSLQDKYGERFYRMWEYYLHSSAGGFEGRIVQLWQVVLSKDGLDNYRAAR